MEEKIEVCNFCSSDIAITHCINCGDHSCGRYIYCCQKIQTSINDNSVICNMCFIDISHKLQPYKYKKKKTTKNIISCNSLDDISSVISNIDKKLDSVTGNGQTCNKINELRVNLTLINESKDHLLKNPLMSF